MDLMLSSLFLLEMASELDNVEPKKVRQEHGAKMKNIWKVFEISMSNFTRHFLFVSFYF